LKSLISFRTIFTGKNKTLYFQLFNVTARPSRKGNERLTWFIYSIITVIIPFTSSKTSNLPRCLQTLFGFTQVTLGKTLETIMENDSAPKPNLL